MQAVRYERFGERPALTTVADPAPPERGAVIEVQASGVCRSDWHGWMGHDPTIRLPHVPGHEFAGVVRAVGAGVVAVREGDRVTAPFVCGCGRCADCRAGHPQVCPDQTQPGFTHWGSFATYVVVHDADHNVVHLPAGTDTAAAAILGCRFGTAFRAVVDQGAVTAGEWVSVHGCGGVGLSAVMLAAEAGANVIAVDVDADTLALASDLGAVATVDASAVDDVPAAVVERSRGGVHLSVDALGHPATCVDAIRGLRRRGRHVQVGLLPAGLPSPSLPMDRIIGHELRVIGSHGIAAHRYDAIWHLIGAGRLDPAALLGRTITLEESIGALTTMDGGAGAGVTVITSF